MSETHEQERTLVRATINLPGLRAGAYALVDAEDPYMADLILNDWLVVEEDDSDG